MEPVTRRQPKQSRDELRGLLVETGRSILRDEGLGAGAESLTFKRVFDRVERDTGVRLTNASIIRRVWENQADFQADVLVAIAADDSDAEIRRMLDSVGGVLDQRVKATGDASLAALRESADWPSWMGVWGLAAGGTPLEYRRRIRSALIDGYEDFTVKYVRVYADMAAVLGFRPREGLTFRQFAIAAESLGEGCELRNRINPAEMQAILRPTGADGGGEEWALFAIGLEALAVQFFEIDPDWVPGGGERTDDGPRAG